VTPAQTALLAQTLEAIHADLGIRSSEEPAQPTQSYTPGDHVRIVSLNQEGVVAEDWDERLLVSIGSMKMMVEKSDVRAEAPISTAPARGGTAVAKARMTAAARTAVELDVRGKRYAEAEPLVERWIDDALLAGNSPLRLIHGKGTGMLGRGLQEYLRGHPAVDRLRYGNEDEGSTGVTMIELKA
jgi:DNA mismatch repair protein MutS2